MLRKQRLQSAEGTIISLCQSETLNWICSLNSLYNFVSHVGSAESIALHLGHSNPDHGIIPFSPPFFFLLPPPVFLSLFSSPSFLSSVFFIYRQLFPWPLPSQMARVCSSGVPRGAPEEIVLFTVSKKHRFVNRSYVIIVMMLDASTHWPSGFQGWKAPEEAISPPIMLNNVIPIHISTTCTWLPETSRSLLQLGSLMCWE